MSWELHDLYSSPSIDRIVKSRQPCWARHMAAVWKTRNAYRNFVGESIGKCPVWEPRKRWEDNIKMHLGYQDGTGSGFCPMVSFCISNVEDLAAATTVLHDVHIIQYMFCIISGQIRYSPGSMGNFHITIFTRIKDDPAYKTTPPSQSSIFRKIPIFTVVRFLCHSLFAYLILWN
jgi:hypothetical protein